MLTPAHVNIVSYFYPIGNTSAVCLTQGLAYEEQANVLLLGCGDVRNILFTTYADGGCTRRPLDITCCDTETAILARNILALSVLLDDEKGSQDLPIWNSYYHLYLDDRSLDLVQNQAKTLYTLSASVQSWHNSRYGKLLRLCDQKTLDELREIWQAYNITNLSEKERKLYNQRFKLGIKRAASKKASRSDHGRVVTGCRSAAPTTMQSMTELPDLHDHFWIHGVTDEGRECLAQAKHPNPMFASLLTDIFTLHYGTDPILGFHLATAYVPLVSNAPLRLQSPEQYRVHKVVQSARLQFRAWGESFRKRAGQNLTIRFVAADALAFCHTLQHKKATGEGFGNWYRRQYSLEPLVLDGPDYTTGGDATLSFNVIDTSNLADHVGAINLLVAASPLLDGSLSATLHMESIVRQDKDHVAFIDSLVGGHFPTVSILCGLFPVEYWTNATATSTVEEALLDMNDSQKGQMYTKVSWKRPISRPVGISQIITIPPIHFDEAELTRLLYGIYKKMFQHEDMSTMLSKPDTWPSQSISGHFYHRGTLAAFLSFIKQRAVVSEWGKVMDGFLGLIENDQNLPMGRSYIQELYAQLHLLDVYRVPTFRPPLKTGDPASAWRGLSAWTEIPTVVCVTLKIPRPRLKMFTELSPAELATPPLRCLLQASNASLAGGWQNIFAVIQLAFGEVTTSGSRDDSSFEVKVTEDRRGWKGNSPLLVFFYVPSWMILLEGRATTVAFGVQSTPHTVMTFLKTCGLELNVYSTTVGNEDNVFITETQPRQNGCPSVCSLLETGKAIGSSGDVRQSMTANLDSKSSQVKTITGRLSIISEDMKSALRSGCKVEIIQISPCIIAVILENTCQQHSLHFPAPVLQARSKCRVARKPSYVEVESPVCLPLGEDWFSHFICPVFPNEHDPAVWNMPRLNLDCLPRLDTARTKELEWLVIHASLMWSSRERKLRGKTVVPGTIQKDVRINFKDSLFSLFMHYTGLQGQRARVFGINNPKKGGVHILFLVSCLRLDLSNHTVILDAAVLPLRDQIMPSLKKFLAALTDLRFCSIVTDDEEMELWKEMLPAFVERCRQWKHRSTCEYLGQPHIPLSVQPGQRAICSCGNGTIPKGFISDIPHWETVSKYAVRAAISPIFTPPFVEPLHETSDVEAMGRLLSDDCCVTCGQKEAPGNRPELLKCARCLNAKYCSVECQRKDWKQHKTGCTK
ncbi:MAG: hypothetical protein M1825_004134 [Sarcosagium campestre]|nr:MAG: hypothetical protein M1825_004134 [Sarcosagium campestre]